jgi:Amt family ammonium transporter
VGLFANGRYGDGWNGREGAVTGLFFGDGSQLVAQVIGVLVCIAVIYTLANLTFFLIGTISPHRATREEEDRGLDISDFDVEDAYADESAPGDPAERSEREIEAPVSAPDRLM